jgi:hypothetical protein
MNPYLYAALCPIATIAALLLIEGWLRRCPVTNRGNDCRNW